MTRITICRSAAELDNIAGLWEYLFSQREYSIFQTFVWNRLVAKLFADRESPYVVAVESDAGAAIIPAVVVASNCLVLLGEELFDYRDCLWSGDATLLQYGWTKLANLGLPFRCKAVRGEPGMHWQGFAITDFTRAMSSTPGLAASTIKLQEQFERLIRCGCRVETIAAKPELVQEMYEARARTHARDLFQDPLRIEMITAMVRHAPEGASLHRMLHGDTVVSTVLTFRDGEWDRFYGTHYDRAWAKYSPGVSLAWWVREQTLERGRKLDYMTGEQHYKQRLADSSTSLYIVSADAAQLKSFSDAGSELPIAA